MTYWTLGVIHVLSLATQTLQTFFDNVPLELGRLPFFPSCCPPGMTWDTLLTLRGTKGIYLDHVATLRPPKSFVWVVVHHKILVTSPEAKFLFPFFGIGLWTGTWPRAYQLGVPSIPNRVCDKVSSRARLLKNQHGTFIGLSYNE